MHRRHVELADAADHVVADPALDVNVAAGAQATGFGGVT